MASQKITEAQWADVKPLMKYLYIDLDYSLKKLREEMIRLNFQATLSQYRTQFRKWGTQWNKNHKSEDTERLSALVSHRKKVGKGSDVYEWGKLLPETEVRRLVTKGNPAMLQRLRIINDGQQRLPKRWVVRTPLPDLTSSLTAGLPFFEVENSLLLPQVYNVDDALEVRQGDAEPSSQHSSSADPVFFTTNAAALNALNSIVPYPINQTCTTVTPLSRQVLHSTGNNFSALGSFPPGQLLQFLKQTAIAKLYPSILSLSHHSTRSIAQSLLKGAIEIGDEVTLKAILMNKTLMIDINQQVCLIEGRRYTPIERASILKRKSIIRIMLDHHADVNKTYPCDFCKHYPRDIYGCQRHGALEYALYQGRCDPEIVEMLLQAGTHVNFRRIGLLIDHGHEKYVPALVSKFVRTFYGKRAHLGDAKLPPGTLSLHNQLGDAIMSLGEMTCLNILRFLHEAGADIKHSNLLDAAAERGSLNLVQTLLEYGATPTNKTLCCAVGSRHHGLQSVDHNPTAIKDGELRWLKTRWLEGPCKTPLEEVFPSPRDSATDRPVKKGILGLSNRFHTACMAIFDSGDTKPILELVEEGELQNLRISKLGATSNALDNALCKVSDIGDYGAAVVLLNISMNLDTSHRGGILERALLRAVRGDNAQIVELILDYGAETGTWDREPPRSNFAHIRNSQGGLEFFSHDFYVPYDFPVGRNNPIAVAAQSRNYPMIKTLLAAGVRPHLSIAVKQKDISLASLLFEAGAEINDEALTDATRLRDLDMVEWLLRHGADPHNFEALEAAFFAHGPIFELLLDSHKKRYPVKRKGFVSSLLSQAISKGSESEVRYLLHHGADPTGFVCYLNNRPPMLAFSPFGFAIGINQNGNVPLVELLLREGCDPNGVVSEIRHQSTTMQRTTALLAAVSTRSIEMVELLTKKGAEINYPAKGLIKRTPIQRAAEIGCFEMVELLYNFNADVNAPPAVRGGATALQLAAIGGYNRIVCYLLSRKADVDAPAAMFDGMTALEGAAANGRTDTVYILLQAGAGSYGKDMPQFEKAIAMARENGHYPTTDLIQDHLNSLPKEDLEMLDDLGTPSSLKATQSPENTINWDNYDLGIPDFSGEQTNWVSYGSDEFDMSVGGFVAPNRYDIGVFDVSAEEFTDFDDGRLGAYNH
ncbi:ankyrin repeat-containing domain protein [Hypoxylon trugodes]|uniref:ankyrin repeat-containing domain protein n=1 Tax=Hypoxylon trugodes TaxID=326681 RepID=UPI00219C93B2|nr:ankyrin repeat-containing domain protein [Hypoxylon trugodes]KAI1383620.1 ankyrin repeat-containing domain protein [Hypoxylon trugodes]